MVLPVAWARLWRETLGWTIAVRADQGLVRRRMEDAHAIGTHIESPRGVFHAIGVFDGLGGEPNGLEAATAAAKNLAAVAQQTTDRTQLLHALNPSVRATGGCTTAVVALLDDGADEILLLGAGDSSAYGHKQGTWQALLPRDGSAGGVVHDFLGNPALKGHRALHRTAPEDGVVLCTDGVDGVLDPKELQQLVRVPAENLDRRLDDLMEQIHRRGAPDNATLVVLRRAART